MHNYIVVEVPADLLKDCHRWGTERVEENAKGKNAQAYAHNDKLPWDNLRANRYAVVAEVAVAQWLGFDPYTMTWVQRRDENGKYAESLHTDADVKYKRHKVEVRNTSSTSNPIPVKRKDIKADAIVVQTFVETNEDGVPTGRVVLTGWINAKTGKRLGEYVTGKDYWNVPNASKKPMVTFPVLAFPRWEASA